jgi:hypothetical protein
VFAPPDSAVSAKKVLAYEMRIIII